MRILYATSEAAPYAKTGGLGDVAGSLPKALAELGHDIRIIMPRYGFIQERKFGLSTLFPEMRVQFPMFEKTGRVFRANYPGARFPVYFVDNAEFFDRPGVYQERGRDYPDNALRFGFFNLAALWTLKGLHWSPHVILCNDWPTGLLPAFLRNLEILRQDPFFSRCRVLFTIHNLAHHGLADPGMVTSLGLPWSAFAMEGLEFYGQMNLLKSGIVYSDRLCTVSPRYAEEIQTEEYGCGLDGVLRTRKDRLTGILNGIDPAVWNPATDEMIPARYSYDDLSGKRQCKSDLQRRCNLPEAPGTPLIGIISRLADQKGFDLIEEAADELLDLPAQWVVLGTGEAKYHALLSRLARQRPERISVHLGFDNELAHWIEAGADLFLMPSRFEPCGLNQLYSLQYGTIPVVRRTGGLADSIEDFDPKAGDPGAGTGFVFEDYTVEAMLAALQRGLDLYRGDMDGWRSLQIRAMRKDFTWAASAEKYDALLRSLADF